jgi:hypothetical protein
MGRWADGIAFAEKGFGNQRQKGGRAEKVLLLQTPYPLNKGSRYKYEMKKITSGS